MQKHRSFLKWAGGKYSLIEQIQKHLKTNKKITTLVEPFVGAGAVFLNTDFENYILNDINKDLIDLYKYIQTDYLEFDFYAKKLFTEKYNHKEKYYALRDEFNLTLGTKSIKKKKRRSVLFLYLNRHGYNGLCRYNKKFGFNVPFGRYKKPYYPAKEIEHFAKKSKKATFLNQPFENLFQNLNENYFVYCDPPYVALSKTAKFTTYYANSFGNFEQQRLANLAIKTHKNLKTNILISNHDTEFSREIYKNAKIKTTKVLRSINCKGKKRLKVRELFAIYTNI